jgi:membrane protein implicated in regulation of membrane protease activity
MEYIEHLSHWIYFAIAVLFIIVDIFLLTTEILILIGGSIFIVGILRWFDVSGIYMLISFPVSLFILTLGYRKIMISSKSNQLKSGIVGNIIGMEAEVISIENNRGKIKIFGGGEWEFISENYLPFKGERVIVKKTEGSLVIIGKKGV